MASATRSIPAALATSPGRQRRTTARSSSVLPRSFYARPTIAVARDRLGEVLRYDGPAGRKAARIVEVEAYLGASDPSSHAYRGPRGRNLPMFGEPGHAYIYISYGVHHCMNVVARSAGRPAGAVLIRGAEPLEGLGDDPRGLAGPGLVGRAFGLTTTLSGNDLLAAPLTIRDAPPVPARAVGRSRRIGLGGGHTLERLWRFYVRGSPGVSRSR